MVGLHVHVIHVFGAGSDIFGRYISTAQALNKTTVSAEQLLTVFGFVVADDDRFAAAKVKAGDRVLVGHSAGQSKSVGNGFFVRGVLPESGSPGFGPGIR